MRAHVIAGGRDTIQPHPNLLGNDDPSGFAQSTRHQGGAWALIHVLEGRLIYRVTDPRRLASSHLLTPQSPPGIVEPTILHEVEPEGSVSFYLEFYRTADRA